MISNIRGRRDQGECLWTAVGITALSQDLGFPLDANLLENRTEFMLFCSL